MRLDEITPDPIETSGLTQEQIKDCQGLLNKISDNLCSLEVILGTDSDFKYLLMRPRLEEPTLWTHIHTIYKMFSKHVKVVSACLLFTVAAQSQPYLSSSILNKGVEARVGVLSMEGLDASFGVQFPLTKIQVPTIFSITVGKCIYIETFNITPVIGGAVNNRQKTISEEQYKFERTSELSPYYSLEFGKDWYLGRAFAKVVHSKPYEKVTNGFYYSIGLRFFTN